MTIPEVPASDDVVRFLRRLRRWLTPLDVAKILAKHRATIYVQIKHHGLPADRDGERWKIDSIRLADWIDIRWRGSKSDKASPEGSQGRKSQVGNRRASETGRF